MNVNVQRSPLHMLSDGDAIAVLHMYDDVVCRHHINKQRESCVY